MTEPHLSLDALADLLAGEGSDADVAHVGACAGCSGRLDELANAELEVAAVLASLPAPPVPDDLAARLQAAFDAEPPLVAAASPATGEPATVADTRRTGSATVTPFPDAGARRARRWLPAAAAVALVVGGGALGTALLLSGSVGGGTDESTTASDTAAGSAGSDFGDLARSETGNDYAAEGTLAAALPGLLDGGASTSFDAQTDAAPEAGQPAPAPAEDNAAMRATEQPGTALEPGGDAALDRLRTPQGLASCLSALLPPEGPGLRPLAVDYAAYQGEPALAVVLPASGAPDKVDVFVVGAGCTAGNDQTLFFTRLDRP